MPSVVIIGTRGYPSYYGGFETAVRKLAPFLADRGWDVTVYGRPGATRSSDPHHDPRVISVETRGIDKKATSTLAYGLTASLDSMRRKPDVALVMNVANGYFLPLLNKARIPSVVNVDGIEWDRAKWGRFAKSVFRQGARATARYATKLVFDSQEIARRWKVEFDREGLYIPYGGDLWNQAPVDVGAPPHRYVLLVARFVPENTVFEFMEAVPELAADYSVILVGSTGYGGELDKKASLLDSKFAEVKWLGHISDDNLLHSLWNQAGAYFHGHSVGGTNPALVQAMACGAPIVARDTTYNREVLSDAGVFCPPDSESIVKSVRRVMDSPGCRSELSNRAIQRVQKAYTWPAVCESYEEGLLDAIRQRCK